LADLKAKMMKSMAVPRLMPQKTAKAAQEKFRHPLFVNKKKQKNFNHPKTWVEALALRRHQTRFKKVFACFFQKALLPIGFLGAADLEKWGE
jgi:hypothetical protein